MVKSFAIIVIAISALSLQACMVSKIVTVPVKVAYGTTKAVVKGTAAVAGAMIPDSEDKDTDQKKDEDKSGREQK